MFIVLTVAAVIVIALLVSAGNSIDNDDMGSGCLWLIIALLLIATIGKVLF